MLSKTNRLKKTEIEKLMPIARKIFSPLLSIIYTPSPKMFLAVIVSKKTNPSSVKRHKIKRQIMSVMKDYISLPYSLIFITSKKINEVSYKEIKEEIIKVIGKIS